MSGPTIFILGAYGFVGGHLTRVLGEKHPDYRLLCLMRNPTPERLAPLKALHPNIEIVEGSLDDAEIISKASEDVDIVLNTASSDHWPSVQGARIRNAGMYPYSHAHIQPLWMDLRRTRPSTLESLLYTFMSLDVVSSATTFAGRRWIM